ncbi:MULTISPECIES: hypothetical protein [unclassified Streptomyces]|uniref:hypothetical protein n=1 Tax=unclassified Streptomyces TaxID=2593676 RepID=UPI00081B0356|nr:MULTISPECIES: hypothetical protein [unclassified Streptomyces]MYU34473.1 hypothetical protein [Streptomyces sp. SID8358]MYX73759.1 hypothetical protein [Streptomyces sp. SID3915]SCD45575.1 hypothetical protein GA0115239_102038 [Streptomyces sp. BpilaLS-43]
MSHNQPGPYGGQPPQGQPGPYGQQPNPYGGPPPQGPPQPGYGYPQQAPQGVPPQQQPPQPGYGYPQAQQPGPYGQQPPTPPYGGQQAYPGMPPQPGGAPKKKTGLIIGAAVVALAVVAGGVYFLTSGGGSSNSDVADSTKGYKLTPAASVDDYKKDTSKATPSTPLSGSEKTKAEAMGVKNPSKVGAQYMSGGEENPLTMKSLVLVGYWGEVSDPAKVIDASFENAKQEMAKDEDSGNVSLVGSPENVAPKGFEGALMKCQDLKTVNEDADGSVEKGPENITTPVCIWADYSTIGIVVGVDVGAAMTNKSMPQSEVADLAAKLYNTSRTKV